MKRDMNDIGLCGALLVLALALGGCGGDGNAMPPSGSKCPANGPALTVGSVSYSIVASQITDNCNTPPLTAAQITGDYTITTDSSCAVTLQRGSGRTIGQGTATSGSFQLTSTEVVSEEAGGGNCQYQTTKTSSVTIADDKTVTIQYSDKRDNFMSVPGKTCIPPAGASCTVSYTLTMTKK